MPTISRRSLLQSLGMAAMYTSFARFSQACSGEIASSADVEQWLTRLSSNAQKLRDREISGLQWQEGMDQIFASTPLASLQSRIRLSEMGPKLVDLIPADKTELFHRLELPGSSEPGTEDGKEPHRVLITKLAYIRKGRAVPPHGHSNMVSAFLCLSGEFEVRQYDRLEEHDDHMVVREAEHQKHAGPGTWSSISDYRNNVHWLTAKTDDCFLFTTKLINIEEKRPLNGRINIDVLRAQKLGSATLRAPKINADQARELY